MRPVVNPPNPWQAAHHEWLDEPPPAQPEVYEEEARSILSHNDSPDIPYRWSLNPYRGCHHACAYCYARPFHEYLGWGAGTDFEVKLVAKVNAPTLLRRELAGSKWAGETIAFSGVTDCYQPLESIYSLTRQCLEACAAVGNPVSIITKSALIRRDIDVLQRMQHEARLSVMISLPILDPHLARGIEPYTPSPGKRLDTIRALADAGLNVGVAVSPVMPGLNDHEVPQILKAARQAGAQRCFYTPLRLHPSVQPGFFEAVRRHAPHRLERVRTAVTEAHAGDMTGGVAGTRMEGKGTRWQAVADLFESTARRLGYPAYGSEAPEPPTTYRRPNEQLGLGL